MRQLKLLFTSSLVLFSAMNSCSQSKTGTPSVLGVFVASSPCSQGSRPLPGMPVNADCALIKWKLTLYQDEPAKSPATYKLQCVYGMPKPGTTGFIGGGESVEMEGTWQIVRGVGSDSNAVAYRLNDKKTGKTISLLKLSDDLLHLLDKEQHLMIGSAAWSYTLNRVNHK